MILVPGQSTFMVEMSEVNIALSQATPPFFDYHRRAWKRHFHL